MDRVQGDACLRRRHGAHLGSENDPVEEAESILRGIDAGLIALGRDGELVGFQDTYRAFPFTQWGHICQEDIVTVAAAADLVLCYDWPKDCIELEPCGSRLDFGAFATFERACESLVISGEAKSSGTLVRRLVSGMRACAAVGEHEKERCPAPEGTKGVDAHPEVEGLRAGRAKYFLAVSPGVWKPFAVTWAVNSFSSPFLTCQATTGDRAAPA